MNISWQIKYQRDKIGPIGFMWFKPLIFCKQKFLNAILRKRIEANCTILSWQVLSIRSSILLFVRLSVRHFWLCSSHRIIVEFAGVITIDESDVHENGQGQRSRSILSQLRHFRTVTLIWIHRWIRNVAQSLQWHRRGILLFCKVVRQIWRPHGKENRRFWTKLSVSRL